MASTRQINRVESPTKLIEKQHLTVTVYKNKKSEEMVYTKFKKDYEQVIDSLSGSNILNKQMAISVLTELGFVLKKEN